MRRFVLVFLLVLALVLPAMAQTNRTGNNNPGGINLGGFLGRVVTQTVIQAVEDAATRPTEPPVQDPVPQQTPANQTTSKKKTPEYRDVTLPQARPPQYEGRPITFPDGDYDLEGLLVVYKPDANASDGLGAPGIESRYGLEIVSRRTLALGDLVVALYRIPPDRTVAELVAALQGDPAVVSTQPQYIYRVSQSDTAPADMRALQYAPARLNALIAREAGDGAGSVIGLIDTGIDLTQPVLDTARIDSFDVMDNVAVSDRGHGTALAGLMLAGIGLDGIAPGARLVSVRAFDKGADGAVISGSYEIAAAIDVAIANGAEILNLSFAGPRDPLVMSVLDAAAERGVILVAAAGNGGPDAGPAYPGAHRSAIAVTATDDRDALFAGANRGYYIAIAAPGVDVLSPMPENHFELQSGTSVATAHVSGLVALMLQQDKALTRESILAIFDATAHDLGAPGPDAEFGAGLADAAAAVAAIGSN